MFLKYMNKGIQLVKTVDWMKEVKEWEVFEATDNNARSWFRNYKGMFEQVEDKKEVKEEKAEKKSDWKKAKAKK
jgi:hypothetical protein